VFIVNKIALFVRESRKAAGLTQEEFAVRSGLEKKDKPCLKTRMHTLQKCDRIIPSKDTEELPRTARGAFFVSSDRKKRAQNERTEKKGNV